MKLGGVWGILLAAGRSTRFGATKQLVDWRGRPLVRHVAEVALASSLGGVVVVVGHDAERVGEKLAGLDLEIVRNEEFAEGQSTSIRAGLAALDASARAALFLPCDQPLLTPQTIDRILKAGAGAPKVVVPTYAGERGAPVLWDRTLFPRLKALDGDSGGRRLLEDSSIRPVEVAIEPPEAGLDFDTREEFEGLRSRSLENSGALWSDEAPPGRAST